MEVVTGSVCRSCRHRLATQAKARSFSTSSSRRAVPPESPYYVDIPSSHQPFLPYSRPQKGILPVPRELFPASRPDKPSKEYIQNATKDALPKNIVPHHKLTEMGRHRAKMSELRKTQLREALTGLHARKVKEIDTMGARSQAKQLQRDHLLAQADREDARLTNVSIPSLMNPDAPATSLDAIRAQIELTKQINERKAANLERQKAQKQAMKMDALHTLYMNARDFVTTEDQFNDLISAQFDKGTMDGEGRGDAATHANFQDSATEGTSLWHFGPPTSIKDMIDEATGKLSKDSNTQPNMSSFTGANTGAGKFHNERRLKDAKLARDQERMKRIAEKLSGGNI